MAASSANPQGIDLKQLTPEQKRVLLAKLVSAKDERSAPALVPLVRHDSGSRYDPFPLTEVQTAYWIGRGLTYELGNVSCHIYLELDVKRLDHARLEGAWQQLIDRHDMLRAIVREDGFQQVLRETPAYRIDCADLRGLDRKAADIDLERTRGRMSHQVLPSHIWPLFELRVSRVDAESTRVHVSFDLLILDFLSIQILLREWFELYFSPAASLAPLRITYRDYVLSQSDSCKTDAFLRAERYWKERLETIPEAPELPLAKDPATIERPHFVRRPATIDPKRWARLKTSAREAAITPSTLLLTAFSEVLAAWSSSKRFTINLTVFNRKPVHSDVNGLIGDFTSTSLLEIDRSGTESFAAAATAVQTQLWKDLEHESFSGVRVQRELAARKGQTRRPLMPVVFTSALSQNTTAIESHATALPAEMVYSVSQTPQVWLDHQVYEQAGELRLSFDFVEDLFPPGVIDAAFSAYCGLLRNLADDPAAWSRPVPCLVPTEQLTARELANDTAWPVEGGLLFAPFVARAQANPDHVAISASNMRMTYGELLRASERWSAKLMRLGARSNRLVAVVMEKGWEQIVAVLAIQMAGAAYLPIDPEWPEERRRFLLRHGEADLVMTQAKVKERLTWPTALEMLCVDTDDPGEATVERFPLASSDDLAYVIFTSGSTGEPKGVMIDHRGALNTVLDMNERFAIGPGDRILALSSLAFDLSVYDIFGSLAAGATIVLPDEDARRDPARWAALIKQEGVTVWNSVPALLELMLDSVGAGVRFDSLRLCFLSGDWIPVTLPDRIRSLAENLSVVSLGGATEASIWSVLFPIRDVDPAWKSIPYGRPMRNQRLHVLDAHMRPCPVWVPGHFFIEGTGLAKGYWKDEQKSERQFALHPETMARLYATGDLGRYLPDGNIEFLGREDSQVKIHGHRIELGEIEAAIVRHPSVIKAVVATVGQRGSSQRLAAYVTGAEVDVDDLRAHVRRVLPEYMIPTVWQVLPVIPLTPNGKVDRLALPSLDFAAGVAAGPAKATEAETELELQVARLWAAALGADSIGLEERFFESGGDSLTAVRLLASIRNELRVDVPFRTLLDNPSARSFAASVKQLQLESLPSPMQSLPLAFDPERRFEPFPLTEIQQAYWIGRGGALPLGNIGAHVYLETDAGELDIPRLEGAFGRLVERHAMLRSIVLANGSQQVLESVPFYPIGCDDLTSVEAHSAAERLDSTRKRMSHQVHKPESWPLFEIRVSTIGPRRNRIHISIDLIIVDVWSFNVLVRDWFILYLQPEINLPQLDLTYRDYVIAVKALEGKARHAESMAYWKTRLDTFPDGPDLPLMMDAARIERPHFERRSFELGSSAWEAIKSRAALAGLTPSAVLLAAFSGVLARWSRSRHFCVNLTLFDRLNLHPQVNDLVGDFTSVTLLEVDHRQPESFRARARVLQEQLWRDLDHRDVSGVYVLRELAKKRGLGLRTLMPVVFTSTLGQGAPEAMWSSAKAFGELAYMITQTPQVCLDCQISERGGNLFVSWDTVDELFPPGLLDDMFAAFTDQVSELAYEHEGAWERTSLCELPAEQLERRRRVNATEAPASGETLHSRFFALAREQPDALAVIHTARTLTYRELASAAHEVARTLLDQGCKAGDVVAVVTRKGWKQIAAVLGVLAAGAAYLPVDADLPEKRIRTLTGDAGVRHLITDDDIPDCAVLDCAEDAAKTFTPAQRPDDLAYVIYTSGSSGLPKGVMISHRAVVNTVDCVNERIGAGRQDRVLALSSLSFDLSVWDIFGALSAGGAIVIPEYARRNDPAHWLQLMSEHGVTLWNSVPALLDLLISHCTQTHAAVPDTLRTALLSGDWVPANLIERIREVSAVLPEMIALGGATEASIWSIWQPMRDLDARCASVPYGTPMRNQRWHVLDEHFEHQPDWVAGQLYIAGMGIAIGYWNDPERSAERFPTHPVTQERLYKTGDLGRYLPDGSIEFLGREDLQVKIHGHRVELGEVESALLRHPDVEAAAVIPVGDMQRRTGLAAHVVSVASPAIGELPVYSEDAWKTAKALRTQAITSFLKEHLPGYMVPASIVFHREFPLTANGKVDRLKLAQGNIESKNQQFVYVGPRNETEARLAEMWAKTLQVERVGIHDNFFEAGGDSLLALQLLAMARDRGYYLDASLPFRKQTIAEIAPFIQIASARASQLSESLGAGTNGVDTNTAM